MAAGVHYARENASKVTIVSLATELTPPKSKMSTSNHKTNLKSLTAVLTLIVNLGESRLFCEKDKMPLEIGNWRNNLKHMDAVVVQNKPVSISEGQMYVYDNFFPGHMIKYVHVDNLAMKSCGASASVKSGGVGSSSILIVLHADTNQEIRSVVDIWGEKIFDVTTKPPVWSERPGNVTSLYLFRRFRTVNHNKGF